MVDKKQIMSTVSSSNRALSKWQSEIFFSYSSFFSTFGFDQIKFSSRQVNVKTAPPCMLTLAIVSLQALLKQKPFDMSGKRPIVGEIKSSQMLEITSQLMPDAMFTNGSIEALRRCHTSFVQRLAHELVALDKFSSYTPKDVVEACHGMGVAEIAKDAMRRMLSHEDDDAAAAAAESFGEVPCTINRGKSAHTRKSIPTSITVRSNDRRIADANSKEKTRMEKRKKRKIPNKWSLEMEEEQERLLKQSKTDIMEKAQQKPGTL